MFGLIYTFIVLKCKESNKNQYHELARSRVVYQDLNSRWEPLRVSLHDLEGSKVRIEIWRLKSKGPKLVDGKVVGEGRAEPIGFAETTFELIPGLCRGLVTFEREYDIALLQRERENKVDRGFYPSLVQIFTRDEKIDSERVTKWNGRSRYRKKRDCMGFLCNRLQHLKKKKGWSSDSSIRTGQ